MSWRDESVKLERIINAFLIIVGGTCCLLLLRFMNFEIDIGDVIWRFELAKVHLASELTYPYFTPARCGGFLLGADAQDLLFTVYTPMTYIIPNILWAIRITNILMTALFAVGIYHWFKYLGIENKTGRIFGSILFCMSQFWINYTTYAGRPWIIGIAFTPFIMMCIEKIFHSTSVRNAAGYKIMLYLVGLGFLLINSGYYWLYITITIIFSRLIVELISSRKNILAFFRKIGVLAGCAAGSIVLSLQRLGAIWEFQLSKFPRMGGEVDHYQVIGATKALFVQYIKTFFDNRLVIDRVDHPLLGRFFEHSDYVGFIAFGFVIAGVIWHWKLYKNKAFVALLIASVFQFGINRTTHLIDLVRAINPIYKSLTWNWRGTAIVLFFVCALAAYGYEQMLVFSKRNKWVMILLSILMVANLAEVMNVYRYHPGTMEQLGGTAKEYFYTKRLFRLTNPCSEHYAQCIVSNIYGYGNDRPEVLSFNQQKGVYDSDDPRYFNMHDVRVLASDKADGGYFINHDWPLWPREDKEEFEKFLRFKQVIELPFYLKVFNKISLVAWILYLGLLIAIPIKMRKTSLS